MNRNERVQVLRAPMRNGSWMMFFSECLPENTIRESQKYGLGVIYNGVFPYVLDIAKQDARPHRTCRHNKY